MSALLKTERLGPVVLITIDHPPSNLVDRAFLVALAGLLDSTDADNSIKSLVFRSADPDFFLMHGDVESILRMPTGVRASAPMPTPSVAAVKRVVNTSLAGLSDALVTEADELGRLIAEGGHQEPMRRFLAAGGQTRESETQRMEEIMRATIG